MKKIFKYLVIIMSVMVMVTGCSSKESHIREISFNELKNKMENKDSFALYIGNKDCSHCISYRPILEEVLNDYNIDIYHLDNSKLEKNESSELRTYVNVSGTPTVVFIDDGEEETTLNRISGEVSREETIERFKTNGYIK